MKSNITIHTVNGVKFEKYSDFNARGTFATNTETGETKQISFCGYITNDLSIRKAIANVFGFDSFRK